MNTQMQSKGIIAEDFSMCSGGWIGGSSVTNLAGDDLGKMEKVALDLDRGIIAFAIISLGGFLSIGGKLFAVPWQAFSVSHHDKKFVLNIPKEKLESAPYFDEAHWHQQVNASWLDSVYRYYGYKSYWMT